MLCASTLTAPAAQAASTGGIAGVITGSGGAALAGIDVTAYKSTGSDTWAWTAEVSSAADGSYLLGGLAAGTYRLEFYDPSGVYPSEYYDNVSMADWDSADSVVVTAGATTSGVDTTLTPGGHITGTVTDSHHVGIADFEVMVLDPDSSYTGVAWTDSAGKYDLGGLATGTYRVEFNDSTNSALTQYFNDEPTIG